MTSIGHATLDVIPSVKGLRAELEKQTGSDLDRVGRDGGTRFGNAAGSSAGTRFGSVFKKAAQASIVGAAALAAGATKLAFDSINSASDLEESTNKVVQVFGKGSAAVLKFTEGTADALGQTNNQAREAASTFGIFGAAAGLADRKNAKFAKRMTTLASDLASFNNTDPSQAVQALGAALRGESEPIRAYGVMLDEATLKAEALALGILKPVKNAAQIKTYQVAITEGQQKYNDAVAEFGSKSLEALKAEAGLGTARDRLAKATAGTIPPLTQQQKLLAAQSQIFKQTEVAQGDFARTSDGLANQQRRLAARFEDAKAKLGKGLLPIMTQAADFLLDEGIPAFERFADWFNKDGIPAIKKFGDRAQTVAGHVQNLVGFLKDLPDPAKYAGLAALLGGGAALKLRGGGGALGSAGKALGVARPVHVFVTNPGFGGGGAGGGGAGKFGALAGAAMAAAFIPALDVAFKDNSILDKIGNSGRDLGDKLGAPNLFGPDTGDGTKVSDYLDPLRRLPSDKLAIYLDATEKKAQGLGRELDLIGSKKVEPLFAVPGLAKSRDGLAQFLNLQIEAGKPITPYITLSGYDRAMGQINSLRANIHTLPGAGVDNGVPFASGGAGVVIDQRGSTIVAHDYNDFVKQTQKKSQQAGLGGRPPR